MTDKTEAATPTRYEDTGDRRRVQEHPHGRYVHYEDWQAERLARRAAEQKLNWALKYGYVKRLGSASGLQDFEYLPMTIERIGQALTTPGSHNGVSDI